MHAPQGLPGVHAGGSGLEAAAPMTAEGVRHAAASLHLITRQLGDLERMLSRAAGTHDLPETVMEDDTGEADTTQD